METEEKEVSECVALWEDCPLFLEEQVINYILCVNLRRQICGLSVTANQGDTERHCVIHRFCHGPWTALSVQRHFRFQSVGVGRLPGCRVWILAS